MAFVHGKSSVFKLDNSGGTLTDISAYLDNVSFPESAATAEVTAFGASSKAFIMGLKDGTFSLSGKYDPTLDSHINGVLGQAASVSFEFGPAGSGGGSPKYTGECFVTSYNVTAPVGDAITVSIDLQVTGNVTRGTY